MIFDTLLELVGLREKPKKEIQIKQILKDAELRQGTQYLHEKKIIKQDIEKKSLLMENFETSRENTTSINNNSLENLANKQMNELKDLENQFQKELTNYTTLSNIIYQDELSFLNREASKYIGKNIKFETNNEIYYVNNFGQARKYPDESRGVGCPSDFINVGSLTIPELGLKNGEPMYKGEPCGYEGKIVQVGSETTSKINLCRLGNAIATQSSRFSETQYPPQNAIDGDPNTFNHTKFGVGEWWQVKLGQVSFIDNIIIINRRDCCQNRFSRVKLDIYDENGNTTFSTTIVRSTDSQAEFTINVNKQGLIVKLTQLDNNPLHMGEVEVYGTYQISEQNGKMGYISGNGVLRQYPNNDITNNTGTCPNMIPIFISNSVWNSMKKGPNMTPETLCEFGNIDIDKKSRLEKINNNLMNIAENIYKKIEEANDTIKSLREKEKFESKYLDSQLSRFKRLFEEYNDIYKKKPTLNAMLEDFHLTQKSGYTKYIALTLITIIIMLFTYKILKHK
jgi:hypothetical protein